MRIEKNKHGFYDLLFSYEVEEGERIPDFKWIARVVYSTGHIVWLIKLPSWEWRYDLCQHIYTYQQRYLVHAAGRGWRLGFWNS